MRYPALEQTLARQECWARLGQVAPSSHRDPIVCCAPAKVRRRPTDRLTDCPCVAWSRGRDQLLTPVSAAACQAFHLCPTLKAAGLLTLNVPPTTPPTTLTSPRVSSSHVVSRHHSSANPKRWRSGGHACGRAGR